MKDALSLRLILFSLLFAVSISLLSRLFVLPEIIGWKISGTAALAAFIAGCLVTIFFLQENKRTIAFIRYGLAAAVLLAAFFYIHYKQTLVCYSVPETSVEGADSILSTRAIPIVTGTTLRETIKTDKTIEMNTGAEKCALFSYIGTHDPDEIWSDILMSKTKLFLGYILLVVFLVALITHLTQEILLNIKLAQFKNNKQVFISYNHEDAAVANALNERLRKEKIPTIFDKQDMSFSERIEHFISRAIRDSRITLSIVSGKSLLSGWVATETVNTFFLEKYDDEKLFIACYLEDDFFNAEFTSDARTRIDRELEKLQYLIVQQGQAADTRDINTRKSRLLLLRNNLDAIVERLQNSLQIDIRGNKFDDNFPGLVKQIRVTLKG